MVLLSLQNKTLEGTTIVVLDFYYIKTWCGIGESNSCSQFGKLTFCH